MGHSLQIEIPDGLYKSLVERAKVEGRVPEELIVESLAAALVTKATVLSDPLLQLAGSLDSHVRDVGERHDHYLGGGVLRETGSGNNA